MPSFRESSQPSDQTPLSSVSCIRSNNLNTLSDWFVKTQTIGGLELLELLRYIYVSLHKWSFIMQKFNMAQSSIVSRERERKRQRQK